MREFKLKRWYPSLPEDWKHKETIVIVEREHGYELHPSLNQLTHETLRFREVYDNEFWEEIVPVKKDYEILKLKAGDNLFAKFRDFGGRERWMRKDASSHGGYYDNLQVGSKFDGNTLEIYSVKRLSDGEVFTIGDKVVNMIDRVMTIISLYLNKDGKVALKTDWTSSFTLDKIRKAPKPLFKTEDGVDIFEGDDVYRVCTLKDSWDVHKGYGRPEIANPPIYFKYFSTLEKAQNFVVFNAPLFSIKDMKSLLKGKYIFPIQSMFIAAAKQKLKL